MPEQASSFFSCGDAMLSVRVYLSLPRELSSVNGGG